MFNNKIHMHSLLLPVIPLNAIHARTTKALSNTCISKYLPYIVTQKIHNKKQPPQQVQRRCHMPCRTDSSETTEEYKQIQWHTTRNIPLHMLWYHTTTNEKHKNLWNTKKAHVTENMTHIKKYTTAHAMIPYDQKRNQTQEKIKQVIQCSPTMLK